jgi:hypothetical protein
MRKSRNRGLVLALTLLVCCPAIGAAQGSPTGAVNGHVVDETQGAMPGVTVTARQAATGESRAAVTNGDGFYSLAALPIGVYTVTFQLDGFKTLTRESVHVEAAVPLTVNASLTVGGLTDNVVVQAEVPMLQVTTAAVSRQLSTAELQAIPSSTRNFTHLLTATTGVSADLPPVGGNDTGSISPSVNGTKTTSNSVLYNGVDITSMLSNTGTLDEGLVPAPETIQEVKLQTSLYDASAGRSGGGNFQLVTKSGSNRLSGSAYSFGQHERFNSNDYFFEQNDIPKPRMRRVESGFTLGGPLARDRAFFFGSFQYSDAESGYVPTASSRAVLPAALGLISGTRTAENIVAAFRSLNPTFNLTPAQISPLAIQLLNTMNPATGGPIIPAPAGRASGVDRRVAIGSFGTIGGDPLAEHRQVVTSQFQQTQGSVRADLKLSDSNRLQAAYFKSDFPSHDPFPDPSTLASPFTLLRNNAGQVASVGNTQVFRSGVVNELRLGYFTLRNTRRQDDPFLNLTGAQFGILNPALQFDDRDATRRLGHFVNRAITWSFGGPNDAFNRREQTSWHLAESLTWLRGNHSIKLGGDYKHHRVDTNLPEEQATEFEKIENFQQFLLGFTSEADTQFGFTEKQFSFNDASWFVTDDWRVNDRLTIVAGLRWDWFGWPVERNGFMGNFDRALVTDPDNPITGLVVPSHATSTGISQVDAAVAAAPKTATRHTLAGEDLNNFAPRLGFAFTPHAGARWAVRGGYGIFYDRPSAAFMNTVFSNYPYLREVEITRPSATVPIQNAFAGQFVNGQAPNFNAWFPFRLTYSSTSRGYTIFDSTNAIPGNPAETLEFRAIDPNLRTPFYHQWNVGYEIQLASYLGLEVRYVGSRGVDLLLATALNEPWDLNDPGAPQFVKDRITRAFRAGGGTASAQDPTGLGFGYVNPSTGRPDNNRGPGGEIPSEVRTELMGFNDAEALLLQSRGRSNYHGLQLEVSKRLSQGYEFHAAYTYSKSKDLFSADPGSTAGGGRPDTPNTGFSVENDSRDLESSYAVSDFDRPHRFSLSALWSLPLGQNAFLRDWQVATFMQFQSGRPFSVFRPEAGLLRLGFQRLDLVDGASLDDVDLPGHDPNRWFDTSLLRAAAAAGNTPRNFLRGPTQKRVDLSIAKELRFGDRVRAQLRWEIFNVFNTVNFGMPENNFDSSDFGTITNTVGGPRVSQFGVRFTF